MDIKDELHIILKKKINKLNLECKTYIIERPSKKENGDY